ncbi:MAG: 2-oxo acid dehydrogenase subunit E2, partial [Alphaproteobacteria bacterium]
AGDRIFASPLARRMAGDAGLDLAALTGSGPRGRIVKADVAAAIAAGTGKAAAPTAASRPAPTAAPAGPDAKTLADAYGLPYTEAPNSNVRKIIARRLTEAKQTIPHFYLTVDCEIDSLLQARKELNANAADGVKLSVNDMVIKAAALALKKVPAANASWTDAAILLYDRVDVAVAVATDGGLITPIVKNADQKGLAAISMEMKDLAGRAREGKLKPEEYQGGTFSVSNLGMFGIKDFGAIINPPHGCILAVGAGTQRPVVKDGALAVATVMSCTLSVDHRVVDGAVGAEFLAALKVMIEYPLSMMM